MSYILEKDVRAEPLERSQQFLIPNQMARM
jgi:hypothetical protein